MKIVIPCLIALAQAHSVSKRDTSNAEEIEDLAPVPYTNILASCEREPDNYDPHVAGNKCTNDLKESSICSVGYNEALDDHTLQTYVICKCDFPTNQDIVTPDCQWVSYEMNQDDNFGAADKFEPTPNPFDPLSSAVTIDVDSNNDGTLDGVNQVCQGFNPIAAPSNGYLFCTTPSRCEYRCNRGYIPKGINNNRGVYTVMECDIENTDPNERKWRNAAGGSKIPFTECVVFEEFCNMQTEVNNMMDDAGAELSYARITGPTALNPRTVGSYVVNAQCINQEQKFGTTGKCAMHLRCGCRITRSTYYCVRNHSADELASYGACQDV